MNEQTRERARPRAPYVLQVGEGTVKLIRGHDEVPPDSIPDTWSNHLEPDTFALQMQWDEPFGSLFPCAAALEALEYWGPLRKVIEFRSAGRMAHALALAETLLAPLCEYVTVRSTVDFWEVMARHDGAEAVLTEASGAYGIDAASCSALVKGARLQSLGRDPARLPYLHGVVDFLPGRPSAT